MSSEPLHYAIQLYQTYHLSSAYRFLSIPPMVSDVIEYITDTFSNVCDYFYNWYNINDDRTANKTLLQSGDGPVVEGEVRAESQ